jgi:hypothetical protein
VTPFAAASATACKREHFRPRSKGTADCTRCSRPACPVSNYSCVQLPRLQRISPTCDWPVEGLVSACIPSQTRDTGCNKLLACITDTHHYVDGLHVDPFTRARMEMLESERVLVVDNDNAMHLYSCTVLARRVLSLEAKQWPCQMCCCILMRSVAGAQEPHSIVVIITA